MKEQRSYFRIENKGEILAKVSNCPIKIIDISASGALLVCNADIPSPDIANKGIITLSIHNFSISLDYELLREKNKLKIIIFKHQSEIDQLLIVLQKIRDIRQLKEEEG